MKKLISSGRIAASLVFVAVLSMVYFVFLYKLQIVEGEKYYEQSLNSIITERTVTGVRGNIMDRYGRTLISNSVCNNLVLNTDDLFYNGVVDDPNAVLLELAEMMEEYGEDYNDELPITKTPPFEYTAMTDLQRANLTTYLEDKGLDPNISAVELMAYFRTRYDIDGSYGAREMRIIAGLRYALNMHFVVHTSDYIFAEDVSIELITMLKEHDIPGVEVEPAYIREYHTSYAAHLLGYVGQIYGYEVEKYQALGYPMDAYVGKDGVELAFEEYLHGKDGTAQETATADGTVISTVYTEEPEPGSHVYLTIDIGLQEAAERALESFILETNETRREENAENIAHGNEDEIVEMIPAGSVAVVDVNSGEPLCLASYPTFDLATLMENYTEIASAPNAPLFNRALNGIYSPGSTFKPCTAIALLDQGIIAVQTTLKDEVTFMKYADAGYTPSCWIVSEGPGVSHGVISIVEAIQESCNYFFFHWGDLLGIDRLSAYAKDFGLGEPTGIELTESVGQMATQLLKEQLTGDPWYNGDTLQASIGQSLSQFTPLQLASYTAALANNGTRYSNSILKSVRSYDYSEKLYEREAEILSRVETEQEYFDAVHQGMWGLSNTTTGFLHKYFYDFPVKIGAKTGTAQMGELLTNNAVFVCYAPYDDPEIAVAVVVEKGKAGSDVAPIARAVMEYYFSFRDSNSGLEGELTPLS